MTVAYGTIAGHFGKTVEITLDRTVGTKLVIGTRVVIKPSAEWDDDDEIDIADTVELRMWCIERATASHHPNAATSIFADAQQIYDFVTAGQP